MTQGLSSISQQSSKLVSNIYHRSTIVEGGAIIRDLPRFETRFEQAGRPGEVDEGSLIEKLGLSSRSASAICTGTDDGGARHGNRG